MDRHCIEFGAEFLQRFAHQRLDQSRIALQLHAQQRFKHRKGQGRDGIGLIVWKRLAGTGKRGERLLELSPEGVLFSLGLLYPRLIAGIMRALSRLLGSGIDIGNRIGKAGPGE